MLFVDQPEAIHEILPGFLPDPMPLSGNPDQIKGLPHFEKDLGLALLGEGRWTYSTSAVPEGFGGDFWSACFLAARAPLSQYDLLRQVIAVNRDLPGHVMCLALEGSGFHGQEKRGWVASKGNIHLTLGLGCDLPASDCGLALTMLPAVAVIDALAKLGLVPGENGGPGIKWVNDILVDRKKLGGVLTSARSQDGRVRSAVLGIGLNVAVAPTVEPTLFTPTVTCLRNHISLGDRGMSPVLAEILTAVAGRFEQLESQGPAPLLAAYREASLVLGRLVEIHADDGPQGSVRRGRVLDIGPDLALTLSDDPRPVTGGRLAFGS